MLLPEPGGELLDFVLRMVGDSLQDVDQVGVGVDAVHSACGDETLEDAHILGTHLGPTEEPVFPFMRSFA